MEVHDQARFANAILAFLGTLFGMNQHDSFGLTPIMAIVAPLAGAVAVWLATKRESKRIRLLLIVFAVSAAFIAVVGWYLLLEIGRAFEGL
jgi:ABC-type enterobactin transport system permease subunit